MGGNRPLRNGSILRGRYRIQGMIGGGGMGRVYIAQDGQNREFVAVKELLWDSWVPGKRHQRAMLFRKEAEMLQRLDHKHIPKIREFFKERGRFYLVMQYIQGPNLLQLMHSCPREQLSIDLAINIALQLSDVLSYLHHQTPPIIFRDLKPENIIVGQGEFVYLVDFGIARFFDPRKQADTLAFASAGYAAPEAIWGANKRTEPRSDLYSLGATLHHCLTGFHPKDSSEPFIFQPASQYNPLVPPSLDNLLFKLVARNKEDRYASAGDVNGELYRIRDEASLSTLPNIVLARVTSVGASARDYNTGQAIHIYTTIMQRNKLPGIPGRLINRMAPFFTAVSIWPVYTFIRFLDKHVQHIGQFASKIAHPQHKPSRPRNILAPTQPAQPARQMPQVAQPGALPEQQNLEQPPRQPSGIFASIASADPVPYLGMLLTTIGISAFMLFFLRLSPFPVLLALCCLLLLFALFAGMAWKIVPVGQHFLGAVIMCLLLVIVMLLALPQVQVFVGMLSIAQLVCALVLLISLMLLFHSSKTAGHRLRRLPLLTVVPLFLWANLALTSPSLQPAVPPQQVGFTMHLFLPGDTPTTILSLLVLLAIVVACFLFMGFMKRATFLVAQVLASLALVMGCIVFVAGWRATSQNAQSTQVNIMQFAQGLVIIGVILLIVLLPFCFPFREQNEESQDRSAVYILKLVIKGVIGFSAWVSIACISLLDGGQLLPRFDNDPEMQSNLELEQLLLWVIFAVALVGAGFVLYRFLKSTGAESRGVGNRHRIPTWIQYWDHFFSVVDSACLLALIISVFFLWQDQLLRPRSLSTYLPIQLPTTEPTFSLLLIGGLAVLSCVFWFWLPRLNEPVKQGTLVFYNLLASLSLAVSIFLRFFSNINPALFELALIVAVVFLAQALLVVMRAEQYLARPTPPHHQ